MVLKALPAAEISGELLEAIRSFPLHREVEHCGERFAVASLDTYAECPTCGSRIKLRSFSAAPEIEDVFDAVLEWLDRPEAQAIAQRRQASLRDD